MTISVRRKRWVVALATGLLIAGACVDRLLLAVTGPFSYDEVFVMALGIEEMMSGEADRFIDVPLRRSLGITPLWWWLNVIPRYLAGEISLAILRVVPVLLGLIAIPTAYLCARGRFGKRTALWFCVLVGVSDLLVFTNSRGEYAESLIVILLIPAVCLVGRCDRGVVRGLLWLGMMGTSFGKGLFIVGLAGAAELLIMAVDQGRRRERFGSLVISTALTLIPIAGWFFYADRHLESVGGLQHVSLESAGVWQLATDVTLGYSRVRAHVVGTMRDAVLIYSDAYVWPVTVVTAIPLLVALTWTVGRWVRRGRSLRSRRDVALLGLAVWTVIGVSVVVSGGVAGGRFHLSYLPAAWLLVAIVAGRRTKPLPASWILPAALLWSVHVGLAASWVDWQQGQVDWIRAGVVMTVVALMVVGACAITRRYGYGRRQAWAGVAVVLIGVGAAWGGPLRWAAAGRFEPMYGSQLLTALDDFRTGRGPQPARETGTLYLYLTHYFLTQDELDQAEHFGRLAVNDTPDLAGAWFYLGLVYDAQHRSVELRRQTWQQALDLKPASERIRARLAALPPV